MLPEYFVSSRFYFHASAIVLVYKLVTVRTTVDMFVMRQVLKTFKHIIVYAYEVILFCSEGNMFKR